MASSNHLNKRLDALEDQTLAREIDDEAARIAAQTGADPDWLVRRAAEIGDLIERFGLNRTTEIVAVSVGLSAEELESHAARLAPGAA